MSFVGRFFSEDLRFSLGYYFSGGLIFIVAGKSVKKVVRVFLEFQSGV